MEHTARVNCVKWIKSSMDDPVMTFASGSNDQTCILWKVTNIRSNAPTITTQKLQGHVGGVTVVEAIEIGERLTIATASTDSTIKLWRKTDDNVISCVQTISLGNGLCFSIRMCRLPDTEAILMAVATDDDKIHLYCEKEDSDFTEVERLVGHEDWVRGLDFIVNGESKTILSNPKLISILLQTQMNYCWPVRVRILSLDCGRSPRSWQHMNPTSRLRIYCQTKTLKLRSAFV